MAAKKSIEIEHDGKVYKVKKGYLELVKDAPGYLLTKAGSGSQEAQLGLIVFVIDALEEGEFKELLKTASTAEFNELVEKWAGANQGK